MEPHTDSFLLFDSGFDYNRKNKKGIAAFFLDKLKPINSKLEIIKEEMLLKPKEFEKYPEKIKIMRNTLIQLACLQIVSSFFGMLYILIRKSFIYLFINLITTCLALVGLYGALIMSAFPLIIHCLFTSSLTAGFFIFQIVDFALISDSTQGKSNRVGDSILLIIFSLPYLFDLYTGLFNFNFMNSISKLNQSDVNVKIELSDLNYDEIVKHVGEEKLCIICCVKEKQAVQSPCGHMLCCMDCAKDIKRNLFNRASCPVCREKIVDVIKLYQ